MSHFTFGGPALFFAQVRLYADRVELSGWRLTGRYHRRIPIERILQVDVPAEEDLLLWLSNGKTLRLGIPQAHAWKAAIEAHQARLSDQQL